MWCPFALTLPTNPSCLQLLHFKVARNEVDCASMTFSEFGAGIFTEDVECNLEHSFYSENGAIRMRIEISALFTMWS